MSSLKQNIRSVLADVEVFLVETIKSVKLNSSAKDHKDRLLEKIRQLLDEIPGSTSSQPDINTSGGSLKVSGGGDSGSGGTSSTTLQSLGEEESGYADNITKVAASDLKHKLQTGMLDKKKKSGFKTWDPLYCVVSGNLFYMYKKQSDSKQKEAFCLNGYEFQEAPWLEKDASKKDMCFEVTKAGAPTYQFRAGSKEGMIIWKEAITKGMQISAEEEPGEDYDQLGGYEAAVSRPYFGLHHFSDDYDIYERVDGLDDVPSFHAPPLPQTLSRPVASKANDSNGLVRAPVASQQKATTNKPSSGGKLPGDSAPIVNMFKASDGREGHLLPSDIKKGIAIAGDRSRQTAEDSVKKTAGGNAAGAAPGKAGSDAVSKRSSLPRARTGAQTAGGQVGGQARVKSGSGPPRVNRALPPPPMSDSGAGSRGGQGQGQPNGARPPSSSSDSGVVQSSNRSSPPPQGPAVSSLKKMFE